MRNGRVVLLPVIEYFFHQTILVFTFSTRLSILAVLIALSVSFPKYLFTERNSFIMIIHIQDLVKYYDDFLALDHLSLSVEEGEIFGLLGPNGSGKTTTMNCILELLRYDSGTLEVMGEKMRPDSYHIKRQIGIVPQNVAVFAQMNVYENIDYFCGLYVPSKKERKKLVQDAIAFTGLQGFEHFRPGKLSGGLLRRLNIACGIAHRPQLIIMDEPTVAVDPQSRNKILEGIQELNRQGSTILYTSHYMEEVEQICTRIAIMDHGKCLACGTKDELKQMVMEEAAQNGHPFTEPPTLNDVFLAITGTELRD